MPNANAPGAYISIAAAAPSPAVGDRTGTWFVTGECEEGPVGVAIPLLSMNDYLTFLGSRPGYTQLYDALDEFFHDGGSKAFVSRIVGASPVAASLVLDDRAESPLSTLTVTANGAGVWGNAATVAVANGTPSNSYVITIVDPNTGRTWTSPSLFSPADAVIWAQNLAGTSPWNFPFTITNNASATSAPNNNPAVISATELASGDDDLGGVTETQWTNALTAFVSTLGPGQVSAPGHTTEAGYEALVAHASLLDTSGCLVNNRFALLDPADTATASNLITQVGTAQAGSGDPSYAMFLAPWVIIPGVPPVTVGSSPAASTRTVPPSSLAAALMARNDQSNNAGVPAAGANGQSTYAIGVTQVYSQANRGLLDQGGVSVIRQGVSSGGPVLLYGYKTIATNPSWVSAAFARMRMELVDALNGVAQGYVFAQIDGKGQVLSRLNGDLAGVCQQYWQDGALYGATPAQAFSVNTGPSVNTAANIANGVIGATVSVRFSPYAEFVDINITNYPVSASLPS